MAVSEVGRCQGYVIGPRIPGGLAAAVEGLAREILRHRPENIYAFAAHHFEQLVKVREEERLAGIVWSGRDKNDPHRVKDHGDRSYTRAIVGLFEETEANGRRITTRLPKRRKEASNRSGWSINQTIRAFKRHLNESEKEQYGSRRRMPAKGETRMEFRGWPDQRSPNSKVEHPRFLRSSSTGDIFHLRSTERQLSENGERFSEFLADRRKKGRSETEGGESGGLKRQKSADQIETARSLEANSGWRRRSSRRSDSLASDQSKGSESGEAQTTGIPRNRTRSENGREACSESQRREKKKSAERFRSAEQAVKLSRSRSEQDEGTSEGKTGNGESTTNDRRIHEDVASTNRRVSSEASVVLPSVLGRPSSSRYSRIDSRTDPHESSEADDPNNLILPPISSDTIKSIKKDNVLVLPSLPTTEAPRRETDAETQKKQSEFEESLETQPLSPCSTPKATENEREEEEEEDETFSVSEVPILQQDMDEERETLEELEFSRHPNIQDPEIEEIFKDSLNVTPDSIEVPERPDSLEQPEHDPSATTPGKQETGESVETRESKSNELKNKLIEIEMVERNIENALASSQTIVPNDEPMEPVKLSSDSEGSYPVLGAEPHVPREKGEACEKEESTRSGEVHESENGSSTRTDSTDASKPKIRSDEDEDRSDVRSASEEFSKPIGDRFCYVLTEGSPCEIPESVTTVIIPDRTVRNVDTAFLEIEQAQDDVREVDEYPGGLGKDPFGEYVCPESFRYATNIDVHFLRGIKNADRTAVYQDLGNIKEEEENDEKDREDRAQGLSSSPRKTEKEVGKDTEVECATPRSSDGSNVDVARGTSEMANTSESKAPEGKDMEGVTESTMSLNEPEESSSDRSSGRAGSVEPYVPELNLDSLQDATITSSKPSDSENIEIHSGEERDIHRDENALFSSDGVSLEKRGTIEEDSSLKSTSSDREIEKRPSEEVEEAMVPGEQKKRSSIEEEIARELIEYLARDTSMRQASLNVENETGVETIDSLDQAREDGTVESEQPEPEFHPDAQSVEARETMDSTVERSIETTSTREETTDDQIEAARDEEDAAPEAQHRLTKQGSIDETRIDALENRNESERAETEEYTAKQLSGDSILARENQDAAARKIQSWVRKMAEKWRNRRDSSNLGTVSGTRSALAEKSDEDQSKPKESDESKQPEDGDRSKIIEEDAEMTRENDTPMAGYANLRHTGEFHDSLALPVFEISRSLRSKNARISNDARDPENPWLDFDSGKRADYLMDPDVSRSACESPRPSLLYAFDLPGGFRPIHDKSIWSASPLSFLPCIVQRMSDGGNPFDAIVAPLAGIIFDPNADNARESSVLREPSNSVLIEEISNADEEKKQTSEQQRSSRDNIEDKEESSRDNTLSTGEANISVDKEDLHGSLSPDCSTITDGKNE